MGFHGDGPRWVFPPPPPMGMCGCAAEWYDKKSPEKAAECAADAQCQAKQAAAAAAAVVPNDKTATE